MSYAHFSDELWCIRFIASLRWDDGKAICPRCESEKTSFLSTRLIWKCLDCHKQFSVKVGTLFEDSPLSLGQWLNVIWIIANSKTKISSYALHNKLGITQKSAWYVLHRIQQKLKEAA